MTPEEQQMQEQPNQMPPNQEQSASPLNEDPLADKSLDKFKGADGQLDAAKLAKSYKYLEQKLGAQDLPPDSPDAYGLPEGIQPEVAEGLKGFMEKAHKVGMTKKQVDLVVGEFTSLVQRGTEAQQQQGQQLAQQAQAQLQQEWGPEFEKMVGRAKQAFNAVADEADRQNIDEIGNNVPIMRMLAKLGENLEEDTPAASRSAALPAEDLQSLMKSEAYWNPKHPDHARTKKQITNNFQRRG